MVPGHEQYLIHLVTGKSIVTWYQVRVVIGYQGVPGKRGVPGGQVPGTHVRVVTWYWGYPNQSSTFH